MSKKKCMTWGQWRASWGFPLVVVGGFLGVIAIIVVPVILACGSGASC